MKLKMSLFSRSLIISDIKRFWWVSALYALGLGLFLILPLQLNQNEPAFQWDLLLDNLRLNPDAANTQIVFICTIPVGLAVLLFKYMQRPKSSAVLHALPFSRRTTFLSHSITGLFLLTIPVILSGLILLISNASSGNFEVCTQDSLIKLT